MSEAMVMKDVVRPGAPYGRMNDQPMAACLLKEPADSTYLAPRPKPPAWSPGSLRLIGSLSLPPSRREPAVYRRSFIDDYVPNESSLLPAALARQLHAAAFWRETLPYGTCGARMMNEFLLDFSWSSSRLEGNPLSRPEAAEVLGRPRPGAGDALPASKDETMVINHQLAIDVMLRYARPAGLTRRLVEQMHAALMRNLLGNPDDLGRVRRHKVEIEHSVYSPCAIPALLQEVLEHVVAKASVTRNPVEAAFFLWVNLAYLQAFADGNKRTSRLSANVPLLLANCAPLTFVDVDRSDYATAMLGVYEQGDLSAAIDLFEWTYRRSMRRYLTMLERQPGPDPHHQRHYHAITQAMQAVVIDRKSLPAAVAELRLHAPDDAVVSRILRQALTALHESSGAAYRLSPEQVMSWIAGGRPH
ncbi:Fic family protein [Mitsuaria sp. GD03876]|uniref:Fic family protein n=1 Tax=Mitsuaria sp. GD03876 TaxID=2975399 RepID=UPI00244A4FEC|nr:Fic family protein [Mitsuaria sp. GD03876]MDH0867090.1 Fic family protein [Mitsuaria sp. GD03876]